MPSGPVYLDHHATTPLDPRVLDAMMPYLKERFGNAASRQHPYGWEASRAVERAREQIAALIGARDAEEVLFTSGATESDNLAIKGIVEAYRDRGDHVVTAATEHKAVLEACAAMERRGTRVTRLPVGRDGLVDPAAVREAITPRTVLVSVMAANNEIGVVPDLAAIGAVCREKGVLLHADAAQAAGKIPFDVEAMAVDLASLSAHKVYGPKGVGALFARKRHPALKRVRIAPLIDGGGHERGLRSGTLNVPGAVGMGMAFEIARRELAEESKRIAALRDRLWEGLRGVGRIHVNGHPTRRLPGNLNATIEQVEGEALLQACREIAFSTGAACSTATPEPSHVLRAIGLPEPLIFRSFRFCAGRFTTAAEIDRTIAVVTDAVKRLRPLSPIPP